MNLFIFGCGYSARAFVAAYHERFDAISATVRAPGDHAENDARVVKIPFDGTVLNDVSRAALSRATHVLVSIPPDANGDPVLRACGEMLAASPALRWIAYLSSVAVYGDHGGAWIDEDAALNATSARGRWRIAAEQAWRDLGARGGKAVHVFRLAGIYGPGRNALANLRDGTAKRIVKPGQVFNRIHVDDIAAVVAATLDESAGGVWNVADDEPSPPQDVIAYAANLLGVQAPPEIPFDAAAMSPMAASFFGDVKRVSNRRLKQRFGLRLAFPTYRGGLSALAAAGEGR